MSRRANDKPGTDVSHSRRNDVPVGQGRRQFEKTDASREVLRGDSPESQLRRKTRQDRVTGFPAVKGFERQGMYDSDLRHYLMGRIP